MRVKMLSTARAKTKKVQKGLVLAQADLHEANQDLTTSIDGRLGPTRESVAAAVEQTSGVEAQLHEAVHELTHVTELLRVAEATIDEATQQGVPATRSGDGVATLRAQIDAADQQRTLGDPEKKLPK
jgi:hypothetical protein